MNESELQGYINRLNLKSDDDLIFKRPIGENVEIAKVWDKWPELDEEIKPDYRSYTFFFIHNDDGEYVGAVLDMSRDLHWYVVPSYRGKGHLSRAMKNVILPYLYELEDRDKQRISIKRNDIGDDNFKASKNVALNLGFVEIEDEIFELDLDTIEQKDIVEKNTNLTEERLHRLKNLVLVSSKIIHMVAEELEMAYDHEIAQRLKYNARDISDRLYVIDDMNYIYNKD